MWRPNWQNQLALQPSAQQRQLRHSQSFGGFSTSPSLVAEHPGWSFVLQRYAPGLAEHLHYAGTHRTVAPLEHLALCCDELGQDRWQNAIVPKDLTKAYEDLIQAVRESPPGDEEAYVSASVARKLDRAVARDRADARTYGQYDCSVQSQYAFRCWAEASKQGRSRPLGAVLHSFFARNADYILRHDDDRSLVHWCYAIVKSWMTNAAKSTCLRLVLQYHADLLDLTRRHSSPMSQVVAHALARIDQNLDYRNYKQALLPAAASWGSRSPRLHFRSLPSVTQSRALHGVMIGSIGTLTGCSKRTKRRGRRERG